VQILATPAAVRARRKIGQRFLVPKAVKKTSGVAANLLWDNAEYVLGHRHPRQTGAGWPNSTPPSRARIDALPDADGKPMPAYPLRC
jgi:CRISPR-associated protein Csd1